MGALREAGVAVYSLAPARLFVGDHWAAILFSEEPIVLTMKLCLTLVLFGDVAMDRKYEACNLLKECVFIGLALASGNLLVKSALWLVNTDGVLDAEGKLVRLLYRAKFEELGDAVASSTRVDVTGGMKHKVESALTLAELGVTSIIANGNTKWLIRDFLGSNNVTCTLVRTR